MASIDTMAWYEPGVYLTNVGIGFRVDIETTWGTVTGFGHTARDAWKQAYRRLRA